MIYNFLSTSAVFNRKSINLFLVKDDWLVDILFFLDEDDILWLLLLFLCELDIFLLVTMQSAERLFALKDNFNKSLLLTSKIKIIFTLLLCNLFQIQNVPYNLNNLMGMELIIYEQVIKNLSVKSVNNQNKNLMYFLKNNESLNNKQMQPGQTLFQYLKRKKQIALKQSLQNSFQKSRQIQKSPLNPHTPNIKFQTKQVQTQKQHKPLTTKHRNKKSSNKKHNSRANKSSQSRKQNNSILANKRHINLDSKDYIIDQKTTRREVFEQNVNLEPESYNVSSRKPGNRSFISMISPLKNKNNFSQSLSNTKKLMPKNVYNQNKKTNQIVQNKIRKSIKDVMTKINYKYSDQIRFRQEIKQKLKQYFILINSILVHLDDINLSDTLDKKIKLLRSNTKIINSFINSSKQPQDQSQHYGISAMIDELQTTVNQSLDSLQGQIKVNSRHGCQQQIRKMKEDYQYQIEEINKEKTRLSREINLGNKNYQKLQKQYDKLLQKYNRLEQKSLQKHQMDEQKRFQLIQNLENKIVQLQAENKQIRQKLQQITKKYKDTQFYFDQYKRNCRKQYDDKLNQRQTYLLKQINLLKNQCSKDVKSLSQIHVNREDKLLAQIKNLQISLKQHAQTIQRWQNLYKQVDMRLKLSEQIALESKKKAQNSLLDLCRMNQELYRHWIGLKDIKTLLNRLNLYDKFQRIYKDIPFNELLFMP